MFKVNPPLRTAKDVEAVREGLADGTIDIVATDHAPHPVEDKDCEWASAAFGMTGLETALSVVQQTMVDTGRMTWADVARVLSENPARIGRIGATQGRPVAVGEPANLTLVDPAATRAIDGRTQVTASDNTPFAGMELPGRVVATFLRGRATVLDGAVVEEQALRRSHPMKIVAVALLVLLAIFLVLYVTLIGRRRLAQRTTTLVPVPPPVPGTEQTGTDQAGADRAGADQTGPARFGPLEAVYVSTTLHGDWLARVGAHGLGDRSNAFVSVHDAGVLIEREGADDLWLPVNAIRNASLAPGMAGKYVGADGLVVLTWAVPEADDVAAALVDTGLRTRRAEDRGALVDAVRHLLAAQQPHAQPRQQQQSQQDPQQYPHQQDPHQQEAR